MKLAVLWVMSLLWLQKSLGLQNILKLQLTMCFSMIVNVPHGFNCCKSSCGFSTTASQHQSAHISSCRPVIIGM